MVKLEDDNHVLKALNGFLKCPGTPSRNKKGMKLTPSQQIKEGNNQENRLQDLPNLQLKSNSSIDLHFTPLSSTNSQEKLKDYFPYSHSN